MLEQRNINPIERRPIPDNRYSIAVIIIKARITPASSRTSPTPNRSFLSIF